MIVRKANGWELWSKGLVPTGCELVSNGYHICKEDRSEHYAVETYSEAETKFVELSGATRWKIGKTPMMAQAAFVIGVPEERRVKPFGRPKLGESKKIEESKREPKKDDKRR